MHGHRITLAFAVTLLACQPSGGGDPPPGCYQQALGWCQEYRQVDYTDSQWSEARELCADMGGAWGSCPQASQVGACELTYASGAVNAVILYSGIICSAEEGDAVCNLMAGPSWTVRFVRGAATCGPATDNTLVCDMRASDSKACVTLSGPMAPERVANIESRCTLARGVMAEACPTAGVVATCVVPHDFQGLSESTAFYAGADLTAAQADCADLGGTWKTKG